MPYPQPPQSIKIYRDDQETYLRFIGDTADEANTSSTLYVQPDGTARFVPAVANDIRYFHNHTADPHVLKRIWTDVFSSFSVLQSYSGVEINEDTDPDPQVRLYASSIVKGVGSLFTIDEESIHAAALEFNVAGTDKNGTYTQTVFRVNDVQIDPTNATQGDVLTFDSSTNRFRPLAPLGVVNSLSYSAFLTIMNAGALQPGGTYLLSGGPRDSTRIGSVLVQAVTSSQLLDTAFIHSVNNWCEVSYNAQNDICYRYKDDRGNNLEYNLDYALRLGAVYNFPRADTTLLNVVTTPARSNRVVQVDISGMGSNLVFNTLEAFEAGVIKLVNGASAGVDVTTISFVGGDAYAKRPVVLQPSGPFQMRFLNSAALRPEGKVAAVVSGYDDDWVEFTQLQPNKWYQTGIGTY